MTALFYDILDYYWEREYKKWRPTLVGDLSGKVLEAGVGTGRNLEYYNENVDLVGIELSKAMLRKANHRKHLAKCNVSLIHEDATVMQSIEPNQFDWVFSTFMCCVMPDDIQKLALEQFSRILKIGGKFKLLEIIYSNDPKIRKKQERSAAIVEKIYGARFDRNTLRHIESLPNLEITKTSFLKDDTYLLIEGIRV